MSNKLDVTGKWYGVLSSLGIDRNYLQNKHGPCPICMEGTDRFRFDDKDGRGTYYCNTCGAGDGFELLQKVHGWSFTDCLDAIRPIIDHTTFQPAKQKKDPVPALRKVAKMAEPIRPNSDVETYLTLRGINDYPDTLKEASLSLGVPYYRTILKVILPTGFSGIATGTLLGVARVSGETAPLLFTAFGNPFMNVNILKSVNSLPLLIFNYATSPYQDWQEIAWGASLILIAFVFCLSIVTKVAVRR